MHLFLLAKNAVKKLIAYKNRFVERVILEPVRSVLYDDLSTTGGLVPLDLLPKNQALQDSTFNQLVELEFKLVKATGKIKVEDILVEELAADIVLLRYTAKRKSFFVLTSKARRSSIWKRTDSDWQRIFHESPRQ